MFPEAVIITNVNKDNTAVTEILPVTFADPGIIPVKLLIKIKKNTVNKNIVYFSCLGPILDLIMSSLTNSTRGSIKPWIPFGAPLLFLDLDAANNNNTDAAAAALFPQAADMAVARGPRWGGPYSYSWCVDLCACKIIIKRGLSFGPLALSEHASEWNI